LKSAQEVVVDYNAVMVHVARSKHQTLDWFGIAPKTESSLSEKPAGDLQDW